MTTTSPVFAEHEFRKASRSDPKKQCVEVARRDGWVEMRDDKLKGTADYVTRALRFTEAEFDAFLVAAREGRTEGLCLEIGRRDEDGVYLFRRSGWSGIELEFTEAEVVAFRDGIAKHEFDALAYAV
ncbi:DUF397 domain-containing protein [Saccharopolyspora phatthalungensis]|uniref:DUF397 domain-containing protein n=1 Tax=Saccharopolyspora phatthalungensis TaxID=664693 RepID=A0A840Q8B7_9PSEU|nr:DUF397 domain-containing protein [Saccharopolyspora phatthalungensis]MBB5154938.1 hypothetical protein [Saccharopolyspora phatthalungensis]